MHIFKHHIWWFYKETNGQMNDFNMEGAEKLNDVIKTYYHRSSSKVNVKQALSQIIEKQNRCEIFKLDRLDYTQKKTYRRSTKPPKRNYKRKKD